MCQGSVDHNALWYITVKLYLFAGLVAKVDEVPTRLAKSPSELTALAGEYRELTPMAAKRTNHYLNVYRRNTHFRGPYPSAPMMGKYLMESHA